jgi:hypothetical protein
MTTQTHRPLYVIASEIRKDWGSKINFGAKPYLDALSSLENITDKYMMEDGKSMIIYFLSNATTWRGETAKRIKAELKKIAGIK